MLNRHPELRILSEETKRLRLELDDEHIIFGFNVKSQELEAWYKPKSSSPYKICSAVNVFHAIRQMRDMLKYEKIRAKDLLAEIDAHNEKVILDKENDAMTEVRHDLERIACGRQFFTMANPKARRFHAKV